MIAELPNWETLASRDEVTIEAVIWDLGLARQRAARLRQMARWVLEHGGALPGSRDELEGIPGIGPYVASAILASRGEPEPLVGCQNLDRRDLTAPSA